MSVISRSSGRSAVAAAAYRSAETLTNERDGLVHKYENRQGVEHSQIVLPDNVSAEWALDRSTLWNAAERSEKRIDARVAREFVLGLPHEVSAEVRLGLTQAFAADLANRYGAAVDFAIHAPHPQGDVRNHHAHVLMTTRQVTSEGLGAKTYIEFANKELLPEGLPPTQVQLVDIRRAWEGLVNAELARQGLDIRIDHRSHSERGLEIEPTEHMGVAATSVMRRGGQVDRGRIDEQAAQRNGELIREKPEQVLTLLSDEKSVFDRRDIARALHRYINDDAEAYQNAFASIMASSSLVELQAERMDAATGEISPARYSTRDMVDIESAMAGRAMRLAQNPGHGVDRHYVDRAIEDQDRALHQSWGDQSGDKHPRLSEEQRHAIDHITGSVRLSVVVGFAGAGKSTMLFAARQAWEAQGYRVHGAALSGKAAEGLEESSGIESRTLASWELGWQNEKRELGRGDVFVVDEAGMIGSRQMARFIEEVDRRRAKIVLVGDHEQLQAIGAGAPFRVIAEAVGHAELSEVCRQKIEWQREASVAFATHKTADGLAAYKEHGDITFAEDRDGARQAIVRDYLADRKAHPDGTRVAMAHRRVDVRAINEAIRSELQARGELAKVALEGGVEEAQAQGSQYQRRRALSYQTDNGTREFAEGDRIVFLQNDRDLGVKNGMLGEVRAVEPDAIHVWLDGKASAAPGEGNAGYVRIDAKAYQSFDHGYATTIHKNQGSTVDQAFVMASGTMDRHLTYVAMTRHRDGVRLYADRQEFVSGRGEGLVSSGKLVEHGSAPFEHKAGNRQSYFVTLENAKGERHTTWGVGLEEAMSKAAPETGAMIGLRHAGSEPVRLPYGTVAERNSWKIEDAQSLAYGQLVSRLSRSGLKETTLDYTRAFAERRGIAGDPGIAEAFGVRSEIALAPAVDRVHELGARADHHVRDAQGRLEQRSISDGRGLAGPEQLARGAAALDLKGKSVQGSGSRSGQKRDAQDLSAAVFLGGDEHRRAGSEQSHQAEKPTDPDLRHEDVGKSVHDKQSLPRLDKDRPVDDAGIERSSRREQVGPTAKKSIFAGLKLGRKTGDAAERAPAERDAAHSQSTSNQQQLKQRGMFDGLKLKASSPSQEPDVEARRPIPDRAAERDSLAERIRPLSALEQAVDRYAKAYSSAAKHIRKDLPLLETQKQAYSSAKAELEQVRPGSHALIRSALRYDPKTSEAIDELAGRERVGQLIAGMDRERALQADPNVRADRFIERWNELKSERQQFSGWQQAEARGKVEEQMRGLSKGLKDDPQLEARLSSRSQELGINYVRQEQGIAQEMERHVQSLGRSQGMER